MTAREGRAGGGRWASPCREAGRRTEAPMSSAAEGFCTVEEALEELRRGRLIVLVDDEHRENEGDLVAVAETVTPETINFMLTHGQGILCLAMSAPLCERLHLE